MDGAVRNEEATLSLNRVDALDHALASAPTSRNAL